MQGSSLAYTADIDIIIVICSNCSSISYIIIL